MEDWEGRISHDDPGDKRRLAALLAVVLFSRGLHLDLADDDMFLRVGTRDRVKMSRKGKCIQADDVFSLL